MKLTTGYKQFIEKIKSALAHRTQASAPSEQDQHRLQNALEKGKEYLESLEEFTQEEIKIIQQAIEEDIKEWDEVREHYEDSPAYLTLQESLWQWLMDASDRNQLAWKSFEADLTHKGEYDAGEMVNLIHLGCSACDYTLEVTHPQELLPCPQCGNTHFIKIHRK